MKLDDGICHLVLSYVLLLNYFKLIVKIFHGDVENLGFELSVNLWFFELLTQIKNTKIFTLFPYCSCFLKLSVYSRASGGRL